MALNRLNNSHITLHDEFAAYLDGKSVAVLSRGPSLISCLSATIESYDVVVRVHRPAPVALWSPPPLVQREWQPRVGKRTDILYSSLGFTSDENRRAIEKDFMKSVAQTFVEEGGKFFCRPHPHYELHTTIASQWISQFTPIRYVNVGLYYELWNAIGATPFPGTIVLADILAHNVSRVYIAGMTCYCDKSEIGIEEAGRKSKCDFNYVRSVWCSNKTRVTIDPVMEDLFNNINESIPDTAPRVDEVYPPDRTGVVNDYMN